MNLILIHGDYVTKSYLRLSKFINEAKKRDWEVVRINKDNLTDLPELIAAGSLFENERFFILENANKLGKIELAWLKKNSKNYSGNLIIYNTSTLSKTFLKQFPEIKKIESFDLPKLIFNFLESLAPGNSKKTLKLLHTIIKKEPIEFVFALMARQLRDLYWVKVDSSTLNYPSWRISKLKAQARQFSEKKLHQLINSLAEIDVAAKTSQTNLLSALDLMIVSELE